MKNRREIALILLEKGIVKVRTEDPFYVWRSGIRSPIYCDIKELLSFPRGRKKVIKIFAETIKNFYPRVDVIAGVETSGIPLATSVADRMNLPLIYVRKEKKDHGKERRIEGRLPPGRKNIGLIDDVISTGGSLLSAVRAIKKERIVNVSGFAVFSYGLEEFQDNLKEVRKEFALTGGMGVTSLTNLEVLLEVAGQRGLWKKDEIEIVKRWRENPRQW